MISPNPSVNPYATGNKRYGASGRSAPNVGAVRNKGGYNARDQRARARKNAMLDRLRQGPQRIY